MVQETTGWNVYSYRPVSFIDRMGSDMDVCDAARVSFDKGASTFNDEQNNKLIRYLAKNDHWSPFAHVMLKFKFKAPIFIARQFAKHQVGLVWNEVSRRYIDTDPTYFVPNAWRMRPKNMKQGSVSEGSIPLDEETPALKAYVNQMRDHAKDYRDMVAEGICPEQARMCQPQSMMTEWIWTGSLMAWARFVALRSDTHAQAECWPYADEVRKWMMKYFPSSSEALLKEPMP